MIEDHNVIGIVFGYFDDDDNQRIDLTSKNKDIPKTERAPMRVFGTVIREVVKKLSSTDMSDTILVFGAKRDSKDSEEDFENRVSLYNSVSDLMMKKYGKAKGGFTTEEGVKVWYLIPTDSKISKLQILGMLKSRGMLAPASIKSVLKSST